MDENLLLKIALATAITGIVALYLIQIFSPPLTSNLLDAKQLDDGKSIRVEGIIKQVRTSNNITRITISHEETLDLIIFKNITLEKNQKIKVDGKISEYKGKKELLAESIIIV